METTPRHTKRQLATQDTKRQLQLHKPASRQAYLFMDGGVPRLTFHKDISLIEALINMYVCMYAG
jgi:hypothetical protein